ncbi:DUF4037 domain-containing protein [Rhodobacter sp. Har01]|uniref:DUF4037 domain-containing protein n=1 Tax=Rhodobacter sp. Har01 TaxID=2883999 RepID=UPI001D08FD21|nr:DUF4037 domain-containing protein [Rhodobacter sp. Har01]MCB6180054.1 DUF4037 domain-containing protein [Rhodobacter sp. Har01]
MAQKRSIIDDSHDFWNEVVHPLLQVHFPQEAAQMAAGVFGYGSEVLRLDDEYSTDHHFGLRVNILLPETLMAAMGAEIEDGLAAHLPQVWRGRELREGYTRTKGVALASLEHHLRSTIGLDRAPQTLADWLAIPEEDITHIVAGEVWHDPSARFSAVRIALQAYYPEPVRLRRLAHWSRYFSGMGVYALKRALLRNNTLYASTTFARSLRWGVQMAFLLDRTYYPYDKWMTEMFHRLPRMGARLAHIVDEAPRLTTGWQRKLDLLHEMSDILDAAMVEDGLIAPHPRYEVSATSGYRLLESAYADLIRQCPAEIRGTVPQWEQVHWEGFHSEFVAGVDQDDWRRMLLLEEAE